MSRARHRHPLVLLPLAMLAISAPAHGQFWRQTNGPVGGHVLAVARSNAGTVVAGSAGGGIFLSDNNGLTWRSSNAGLNNATISALAVHPAGDIVAGSLFGETSAFYSVDNGANWSPAGTGGLHPAFVRIIATRAGTLYAAAGASGIDGGIYRSNDRGHAWERIGLNDVTVTAIAADAQGNMVAATDPAQGSPAIMRSADGANWSTAATYTIGVASFTVDSTGTFWGARRDGTILRSTDRGAKWDSVADLSFPSPVSPGGMTTTPEGVILIGTDRGIVRSSDRGASWVPVGGWPTGSLVVDFAPLGNGNMISVGYGIGARLSSDRGESWNGIDGGLIATVVTALAAGAEGKVAAADVTGVEYSNDGGNGWRLAKRISDLSSVAFGATGAIYAGSVLTTGPSTVAIVQFSDENGENWTVTAPPTGTISALGVSPAGGIFIGGRDVLGNSMRGLVRSTDAGKNWSELNSGFEGSDPTSLAFDASGNVFAVASGALFRSTNNGEAWSQVAIGGTPQIVAIDPQNIVYVLAEGDLLFRSLNMGESWEGLGQTPKRFGAIVGNRKGELYAYADGEGVYRSVNRGASWAPVNDGLGNLRVTSIAIDSAGFLYAGTAGSGVFRSIRSTSAGVELEQASTALRLDEPSPNPATAGATIRFALARGGHATLDLVDRLGRRVASLIDGALPPGEHARPVDLAGLPDGLYFVRLRVGEAVATQRLVIVR